MDPNVLNILIAPNAFKHAVDAEAAALAIKKGFEESDLDCICQCFPIADGGDGTGSLIIKQCVGEIVTVTVQDPLGRNIDASFGVIDGGETAVIEMASASGIRLLKPEELSPLRVTSFGTGQLMIAALDRGVKRIILAMGGSATVDGGAGILSALGVQFLNNEGRELPGTPETMATLAEINTSHLDERILNCEVTILCDVDNLLLGPQGSAAVFGPQKGASETNVHQLEMALTQFSMIAFQHTGMDMASVKHGGTAGGAAAGLNCFINARLANGIDTFLALTNFNAVLKNADVVVTGEGSIDEQTLQGKGPFGVAKQAKLKGLPVIGMAGRVPLKPSAQMLKYFDILLSINDQDTDLQTALANTTDNLTGTATSIGNMLKSNPNSILK
ncbi:MAG: glycerate kinase [Mucilaginibacter sp.]|uniref:glycerate kinase n=1 Tax=Mucilaginibacter sp. TaxID=1882438 RepID=UPI0032676EBA